MPASFNGTRRPLPPTATISKKSSESILSTSTPKYISVSICQVWLTIEIGSTSGEITRKILATKFSLIVAPTTTIS